MKNAKSLLLVSLLSISGMALADCASCPSCSANAPEQKVVCTGEGCSLEAVEGEEQPAPTKKKAVKEGEEEEMSSEKEEVKE